MSLPDSDRELVTAELGRQLAGVLHDGHAAAHGGDE